MPIVLSYDTETTGLDTKKDEVVEVGALLYSTGQKRVLESVSFLVKTDLPITEEVTKITGIVKPALDRFGYESDNALDVVTDLMSQADLIIGQNVIQFDKRITDSWAKRVNKQLPEKLWADTRTDLPGCEGKHLGYMAADHGFLNMFPHSALADAQTVLKILSFYDIEEVIKRAKSPSIVIRSLQSMDQNREASKRKFRWKPELNKRWLKVIKECDIESEMAANPFKISIEKDVPVELMWD